MESDEDLVFDMLADEGDLDPTRARILIDALPLPVGNVGGWLTMTPFVPRADLRPVNQSVTPGLRCRACLRSYRFGACSDHGGPTDAEKAVVYRRERRKVGA